jgi:hypothetical protein
MQPKYFFTIVGLLLIYLYNLPRYLYWLVRSIYLKSPMPSYRYIFYVPKAVDEWAGVIGFVTVMVVVFIITYNH